MDFMNLNQAAHGDREFGFMHTRLGVAPQVRRRPRRAIPTSPSRIAAWARAAARLARPAHAAAGPLRRQHARRRRHRGDKVEAQLRFGFSVNAYGVDDLVDAVDGGRDADSTPCRRLRRAYTVVAGAAPGGERTTRCGTPPGSSSGCATFLDARRLRRFTTNFEDLGGLRQLPGLAVQRLMADGYGFGGEGDWKTSALLRASKVMGDGLPGGTSFMEDYTYHFGPGQPRRSSAPTCSRSALDRRGKAVAARSTRSAIGGREDPVRLVFDAAPGPAVVIGIVDLGDRFRLVANAVDVVPPDEHLPRCRWRGPCGCRSPTCRPRPRLAHRRRPAPHRHDAVRRHGDVSGLCGDGAHRDRGDRRAHRALRVRRPAAVGPGVLPRRGGFGPAPVIGAAAPASWCAGGTRPDDQLRLDERDLATGAVALHEPDQPLQSPPAHRVEILPHRRQPGEEEFGFRDVVESDHAAFLRDLDTAFVECAQHAERDLVVRREHRRDVVSSGEVEPDS